MFYIIASFAVYISACVVFIMLLRKCKGFMQTCQQGIFKGVKRLSHCAETLFAIIVLISLACLSDALKLTSDLINGNPLDAMDMIAILQYGAAVVLTVLCFYALHNYHKANKLYCYLYPNVPEKVHNTSVYELMKKYPTADEYYGFDAQADKPQDESVSQTEAEASCSRELSSADEHIYDFFDYTATDPKEEEQQFKSCPYCGTANKPDSESCDFCGALFQKEVI